MCYGGVDLKHLARETESRLAGLPKVDAAALPRLGLLARLASAMRVARGQWSHTEQETQSR